MRNQEIDVLNINLDLLKEEKQLQKENFDLQLKETQYLAIMNQKKFLQAEKNYKRMVLNVEEKNKILEIVNKERKKENEDMKKKFLEDFYL